MKLSLQISLIFLLQSTTVCLLFSQNDCQKQINELQSQKSKLTFEKGFVLNQLKQGKYCSQCNRSAIEIEKTGVSFKQHLADVSGKEIPASAEEIKQKSDEYNQRILDISNQINSVKRNCNNRSGSDLLPKNPENTLSQNNSNRFVDNSDNAKSPVDNTFNPKGFVDNSYNPLSSVDNTFNPKGLVDNSYNPSSPVDNTFNSKGLADNSYNLSSHVDSNLNTKGDEQKVISDLQKQSLISLATILIRIKSYQTKSLLETCYGNYCGEKDECNQSQGIPEDKLDTACWYHDIGYNNKKASGKKDLIFNKDLLDEDKEFVKRLNSVINDPKAKEKAKLYAKNAICLFNWCIAFKQSEFFDDYSPILKKYYDNPQIILDELDIILGKYYIKANN